MEVFFDVVRGAWAFRKPIGWVFTIVGLVIGVRDFAAAGERYVQSGPQMNQCLEHQMQHPTTDDDLRQCVDIYLKAESDLNKSAIMLQFKSESAMAKLRGPE